MKIPTIKIPKNIHGYRVKVDNNMKWYGETDDKEKLIRINKKKSLKAGGNRELRDTILHEAQHAKHPSWSEKKVEKKHKELSTEQIIKSLI